MSVVDEWTWRERCLERETVFVLDLSVCVEVLLRVRDEDLLGVVRARWVLSSCGLADDGAGMDGGGKGGSGAAAGGGGTAAGGGNAAGGGKGAGFG